MYWSRREKNQHEIEIDNIRELIITQFNATFSQIQSNKNPLSTKKKAPDCEVLDEYGLHHNAIFIYGYLSGQPLFRLTEVEYDFVSTDKEHYDNQKQALFLYEVPNVTKYTYFVVIKYDSWFSPDFSESTESQNFQIYKAPEFL